MMELAFELLREASIRMPGAIGNTIGIVGALVIGDAAVSARLVAPQMVIVVAITAIGSFAIPSGEASYPIRLIRFPLMILAASFGLYGVTLGWMIVLMYLVRRIAEQKIKIWAPIVFTVGFRIFSLLRR